MARATKVVVLSLLLIVFYATVAFGIGKVIALLVE